MALKNNPGSGCSISEVSSLVKNAHNVIAQMKLMSVKPELSPEDYAWFSRNKTELSKVLNQLSHLDPTLVGKMRRRQSKRRREKRRRVERKRRKEGAREREEKIDQWLEKTKRNEEMKEKLLKNKRTLTAKAAEIEKNLSLLIHLEKLDKARGGSFEPVTPRLSAELCRLRERIERDGDGLDREEWSEFLFNTSCERTLSPETLLKIRNDWDQFISSEATATSLPIGWVTPSSACRYCEQVSIKD
ncbi:hypothetical protein M8J77_005889 [Diaphorina citri]|nr:hypothetical protein M8J77_005889 [Diaphorina citri]